MKIFAMLLFFVVMPMEAVFGQPQLRQMQDSCAYVDFINPSLENPVLGGGQVPINWQTCEHDPNMHAFSAKEGSPVASDSNTYVGMGAILVGTDIWKESIGQELGTSLEAGRHYAFSVDLAYSSYNGGNSGEISISLGDSLCRRDQLIFTSQNTDSVWTTSVVEFVPNSNYRYVIISGEMPPNNPYGGYTFVDNLRATNIPCDSTTNTALANINAAQHFTIYPNPNTNGTLMVEWADSPILNPSPKGKDFSIVIIDALGRNVANYTLPFGINEQQLDISRLPNGFYTVLLQSESHILARKKLIISK